MDNHTDAVHETWGRYRKLYGILVSYRDCPTLQSKAVNLLFWSFAQNIRNQS